MSKIFDKLIILLICAIIYFKQDSSIYTVVPVILVIIFSSLMDMLKINSLRIIIFLVYLLSCITWPNLTYFIPIMCYDIFSTKQIWITFFILIPLISSINVIPLENLLLIVSFSLLGCYIKYKTLSKKSLKKDYTTLRDSYKESTLLLSKRNKELYEKQDYEVNIAMLKERNRISGEIHDNVGHLLSSSILQIGALITMNNNGKLNESLLTLKSTLSEAMNSIRNSIHNMHDDYIDLKTEVDKIINTFTFCNIAINYSIKGNPDKQIKYCLIYILKEALTNVIKHSNATLVKVNFTEHPSIYQVIINDNGTKKSNITDGIGVKNMTDRINSLNGIINISNENGYKIFISIPKNI